MPYEYVDGVATADVAFRAWGKTQEDMFKSATDATLNVVVERLDLIDPLEVREISLEDDDIEMLFFRFLQELVYFKDAQKILLRASKVDILKQNDRLFLHAEMKGERFNAEKHQFHVDIKAITMHRFQVRRTTQGWTAFVVLDI